MIKVRILDRCVSCVSEAFFLICEEFDQCGDVYDLYQLYEMCKEAAQEEMRPTTREHQVRAGGCPLSDPGTQLRE